jgi:hypothetical protein
MKNLNIGKFTKKNKMSSIKIFCFGFGQVAKSFIKKVLDEERKIELSATSRNKTYKDSLGKLNFNIYKFDNGEIDNDIRKKIHAADYILVSIPPNKGQDLVIKSFESDLKKTKCKWITYLSATSVYGDHKGEWVNESSETKPTSDYGINRLQAENQWLKFSNENNLPIQIFRLSGIYSTKNNILKRLISGKIKIVKKEKHFFSRVHVEDIANLLFHSMKKFKTKEIYNVSDDKPAPQEEVVSYGLKLLKVKSPKFLELDALEDGMLKDFYKDSKKVDNKKVKEFFNYNLIYPTYKEGLDKIFNEIV